MTKKTTTKETIKAVLFCRVSTNQQDYTRQIGVLKEQALRDGYKEGEITIIAHHESASKNDVNNRISISELKNLINSEENEIKAVYVTEISRMSRRNDVLYNVLEELEIRHIALVVLTPTLIRTWEYNRNNEWVTNGFSHIIISFLAQVARQEIELKAERQATGLANKIREGKVCSSKVKFGYNRVNGFPVIDDDNAKVVNQIFQMYISGETCGTIYNHFKHLGVFPVMKEKTGWQRIVKILNDTTYIGQNPKYKYPAIISEDVFQKVQERLKGNTMIKKRLKHVYYCQGLLKIDGHIMTPAVTECVYAYRNLETKKTTGINMNVMDSLLWYIGAEYKAISLVSSTKEYVDNTLTRIANLTERLKGIKDEQNRVNKAIEKLNIDYYKVDSKMKESFYNNMLDLHNSNLRKLVEEEERTNQSIIELSTLLETKENINLKEEDIRNIKDDEERVSIIKESIKDVTIKNIGKGEFDIIVNFTKEIFNDGAIYYKYIQRGCKKELKEIDTVSGAEKDITNIVEDRIKRYERKK